MSSNSGSENQKPAATGSKPEAEPSASPDGGNAPSESETDAADLVTNKSSLRAPFHYAAYVAIALFLVLVDPFEWKKVTSNASQDLAYRVLIGPLYPTDHRDRISVVLFNEATLKYLGATWPTTLGTHAEILKTIREMGPRAAMVDFVFPDQRDDPSVKDLQDEIQAYKDANIPLYFARAEGTDLDWIRPDLSEASLTSIVNPVSDGVSRTYEPCSTFSMDDADCACIAGLNQFEVCPAGTDAASPWSPVALTAAFQLFGKIRGLPNGFTVQDPVPMEVVWSNRLNPVNAMWMRKKTASGLEDLRVDIAPSLADWSRRMWFKSEQYSFLQTCPYTTTISAGMLLKAPGDAELDKILRGKIVFYGADLTGLEDTVVPPTHVKLPGVYLHAMALDNLFTFNGQYKRSSMTINGVDIGAQYVGAAVAVLLALIVVAFARSEPVIEAQLVSADKERGIAFFRIKWHRWKYWFGFNVCMFAVIVAICWALYSWAAISPKNWLGYWGLMTVLSGVAKGRLVEGFARTAKGVLPSFGSIVFKEERT